MSIELTYLLWSVALAFAYLNAQAILMRLQLGFPFGDENRDNDPEPNLLAGRAARALRNYLETWPMFIVLVIVSHLADRHGALVQWGVILWFWARFAYLPAYIGGLGTIRSAIWTASLAGLIMMFIGLVI